MSVIFLTAYYISLQGRKMLHGLKKDLSHESTRLRRSIIHTWQYLKLVFMFIIHECLFSPNINNNDNINNCNNNDNDSNNFRILYTLYWNAKNFNFFTLSLLLHDRYAYWNAFKCTKNYSYVSNCTVRCYDTLTFQNYCYSVKNLIPSIYYKFLF